MYFNLDQMERNYEVRKQEMIELYNGQLMELKAQVKEDEIRKFRNFKKCSFNFLEKKATILSEYCCNWLIISIGARNSN